MTIKELVLKTRSYRRFIQSDRIDRQDLVDLVDIARLTANHRNEQPLKYIISSEPDANARIFQHLGWAAGLKDWSGPEEGERPAAYIIILGDTEIAADTGQDEGIAAQTIALAAAERGIGSCMIGSIARAELAAELALAERYKILLVVALGRPGEKVVIDEMGSGADFKYYRDSLDCHHVPKRCLSEVLLELKI